MASSVPVSFDSSKVPGGDVAEWGRKCRDRALAAVAEQDWRGVHDWTKSWVGWGGGAWLPDTWLLYAVSGLLLGQPKTAVHSLDLGVGTWLDGEWDRAALTWCRGILIWTRLNDPKTALVDLEATVEAIPRWLDAGSDAQLARCFAAAKTSRKRVASVMPRPAFAASAVHGTVAPAVVRRGDGDEPEIWRNIAHYFATS